MRLHGLLEYSCFLISGATAIGTCSYLFLLNKKSDYSLAKAVFVGYLSGIGGGLSLFLYNNTTWCCNTKSKKNFLPQYNRSQSTPNRNERSKMAIPSSRNSIKLTGSNKGKSSKLPSSLTSAAATLATQLQQQLTNQIRERVLKQLPTQKMQQSVLKVGAILQKMDLNFRTCAAADGGGSIEPFQYNLLINLVIEARLQIANQANQCTVPGKSAVDPNLALRWMRYASCAYGFGFCKALGLAEEIDLQEQLQNIIGSFEYATAVAGARTAADKFCIMQVVTSKHIAQIRHSHPN